MYNNNSKCNGLKYDNENFTTEHNNNCYTYAINQPVDPFTKEPYRSYNYCQPGNLGNRSGKDKLAPGYTNIIELVKEDLNAIGLDIVPSTFEEYIPNDKCWKIASAIYSGDYHWYRQNDDGTWSHKMGPSTVRNHDNNGNVITNPETCNRGSYIQFNGFYMIIPLKKKRGRPRKTAKIMNEIGEQVA